MLIEGLYCSISCPISNNNTFDFWTFTDSKMYSARNIMRNSEIPVIKYCRVNIINNDINVIAKCVG